MGTTSKLNFVRTVFIELLEFCAARAGLKGTWMHFPAVNQTGCQLERYLVISDKRRGQ